MLKPSDIMPTESASPSLFWARTSLGTFHTLLGPVYAGGYLTYMICGDTSVFHSWSANVSCTGVLCILCWYIASSLG